jgi:hypothetical protein
VSERCPQCGVALDTPWNPDRPRLNHAAGSKACKVRAWGREAEARDLVRVSGTQAIELDRFGVPTVYGPNLESESDYTDPGRYHTPTQPRRFVTSSYAPRWAAALIELGTIETLGWGNGLRAAFARAQGDETYRLAIASTAMLLQDDRPARLRALGALVREER